MHTRNTVTKTIDYFAVLMVSKPTNTQLDVKTHICTPQSPDGTWKIREFLW